MIYPLVYMLIWTTPTVIRIYQASTGKSAPFAVTAIDKVRSISHGLCPAKAIPCASLLRQLNRLLTIYH